MSLKAVIFFCMLMAGAEARRARIFNGAEAKPHEFPHMVALDSGNHDHVCGGAILNQRWIITAAHCPPLVHDDRALRIKAGKHDLSISEDSEQIIKVVRVIYNYFSRKPAAPNDIALLKLERALVFNDYVQPVALPEKNTTDDGQLSFSGWGKGNYNSFPRELEKAQFIAVDHDSCKKIDVAIAGSPSAITDTMLCAKSQSSFTCRGDSGGPLVKQENNQTVLIGVISWTHFDACDRNPTARSVSLSVFTRVTSYIDWIKPIITNK